MSRYAIYTLDQLQDELDALDPTLHSEQVAEIKVEIERKRAQQPPLIETSNNVLVLGTGFLYLGKYDKRADGSYVSTRFFVMLLLPVFPVSAARINSNGGKLDHDMYLRIRDLMVEEKPLDWKQARKVLLTFYASILAVAGLIWLFLLSDTFFNLQR